MKKLFKYMEIDFLFLLAALIFNVMRTIFGYFYQNLFPENFLNFTAHAPFVNRVLLPLIWEPFTTFGFSALELFKFFDIVFTFLLLKELYKIFMLLDQPTTSNKIRSFIASIIGLFVLGNIYLLDSMQSAYLYPFDLPSIFFLVLCYRLLIEQRLLLFVVTFILATLNRESSIIIIGLFFVIFHNRLQAKKFFLTLFSLFVIYFTLRVSINLLVNKGDPNTMGIMLKVFGIWVINLNLSFIIHYKSCLYLLYKMSFLPLAYVLLAMHKKIPALQKDIVLILELYMATLLFCGIIYEMRCYAEVLMLLYITVVIGLLNATHDKEIDFKLPEIKTSVPLLSQLWIFFTHHAQLIIVVGIATGFFIVNQ